MTKSIMNLYKPPEKSEPEIVRFPVLPKLKRDFNAIMEFGKEKYQEVPFGELGKSRFFQHLADTEANAIAMFSVIGGTNFGFFEDELNSLKEQGYTEEQAINLVGYTIKSVCFGQYLFELVGVSRKDLESLNLDERIISNIEILTRNPKDSDLEYLERVKSSPIARGVKIAQLMNETDFQRLTLVGIEPVDFSNIRKKIDFMEFLVC